MLIFWRPAGIWAIAAAFILGAATYAAFGLLIGVLVRGDLEGFFLIIMISMLDTFLENPVDNPLANKPILEFFPTYAPTQFAAAGAFHHQVLASMAALSPALDNRLRPARAGVLRHRLPAHRPHQASGPHAAADPGTPPAGLDSNRSTAPVTSPPPRPWAPRPQQTQPTAEPAARSC